MLRPYRLVLLSCFFSCANASSRRRLANQCLATELKGEVIPLLGGDSASVSADGTVVAGGNPLLVFDYVAGSWTQRPDNGGLISQIVDAEHALSADGSILAANFDNGNSTSVVKIVEYSDFTKNWTIVGDALEDNASRLELSADGKFLVVAKDSVRVFQFDGTAWVPFGADIPGISGETMENIALSGNGTIMAFLARSSSSSNVRVVQYDSSVGWMQLGQALTGQITGEDLFGHSIAISPDASTLAIGAASFSSPSGPGQVQVFMYTGGVWRLVNIIDGERG